MLTIPIGVGVALAYIAIGGVVYEMSRRIEKLVDGEPVIAAFWPVFMVCGAVIGIGWLAMKLGAWCGARVVDGAVALIAWRRRPRLPRATARKGGR